MPDQIRWRELHAISPAAPPQLVPALLFLNLINNAGQPTDLLRRLVAAREPADRERALQATLRQAYSPLFQIDLTALGQQQFVKLFDTHYAGKETVRKKSRTFFLHAARDARIPLHPALIAATKPRHRPAPATTETRRENRPSGGRTAPAPAAPSAPAAGSLAGALLQLATASMTGSEERAYWTMVKYLKRRGL